MTVEIQAQFASFERARLEVPGSRRRGHGGRIAVRRATVVSRRRSRVRGDPHANASRHVGPPAAPGRLCGRVGFGTGCPIRLCRRDATRDPSLPSRRDAHRLGAPSLSRQLTGSRRRDESSSDWDAPLASRAGSHSITVPAVSASDTSRPPSHSAASAADTPRAASHLAVSAADTPRAASHPPVSATDTPRAASHPPVSAADTPRAAAARTFSAADTARAEPEARRSQPCGVPVVSGGVGDASGTPASSRRVATKYDATRLASPGKICCS